MITSFDGNIWYLQLYDCDSSIGLDNSGAMKFDSDIEVEAGVFNTSNSRLWEKLRRNFPTQILAQWEYLRLNEFTEENIMKYLVDNISDKIPEVNYNKDAWKKYIQLGTSYLFACHGNRRQQIQRWIRERLIYVDTLLEYTVSTNDYLTVRVNKLGEVHFDIQTFQPMYFSIKFRNETGGTIRHRIGRGETVRFSYNIPVATDQEILVYGGRFVKDLGDLSEMNPTNLLLDRATRLTKIKCNDSPALINASISNCTMLQEVDLRNCSNLGGGSDASLQTLDLTQCRNLRFVDIFGTQLTAVHTSKVGGIIQEIIYPYSVQVVDIANQSRLQSVGIPCYYTGDYQDENNIFAENLSEVTLSNCPNIVSFVKNYCVDENGNEIPVPTFVGVSKGQMFNLSNTMTYLTQIDLSYCSNIISLTLDNFDKLTEINFDDISMWNATSSNLENLTLTNCPNVETLTFNQNTHDGNNSLGVAFKEGTVLDLSGLYNLKHIRSNVGVKGLKKLILPLTIQSLVFDYPEDTTYSLGDSDIESIFSKDAVHDNDGFSGIDLLNIQTITDFSMGSLTKMNNAINLDIKITNTFPYFNYFKTSDYFKPEGTVDITEYRDNLDYLFKGVDLNKLTIICDEPLPHTSASYMFAFATCQDTEVINDLFDLMPNVTDFSYMFYNAYLKEAPYIPLRAENVSYMFYNNTVMESTPSNWLQTYTFVPNSAYCYTGCVNIKWIDGIEGSIDVIPSEWGGYERINTTMTGENLVIEKTLEREVERFVASGQSFHNVAPLVGQTPTITANESSQNIGQGLSSDILLVDGKTPYGELEGLTLVNLASEKRSGELTTKKAKDNVENVLPSTFKLDTSKDMPVVRLEGSTLHNVANQDSKTSTLINGDKGSFIIDENVDETTHIKDGKMYSTTLYGQTISNDIAKTVVRHELNEYESNKLITQHNDKEVIYEYGNFENATLKGKTLVNVITEDSKDDDYISFDEDLSGQYITIEDSKYGSIKNATIQGETLINIVQESSETEYIITGDAFEEQSGTLENTVEGNIKSAILKGNTAINLYKGNNYYNIQEKTDDTTTIHQDNYIEILYGENQSNPATTVRFDTDILLANKTYYMNTFVFDALLGSDYFNILANGVILPNKTVDIYQSKRVISFTPTENVTHITFYYMANSRINGGVNYGKPFYFPKHFIISETLDGATQDYFEGMQSVNIYPNQTVKKITWSSGRYYTETGTLTSVNATANHKYFEEYFEVMPNHTLRVIGNNTMKYLNFYDESYTFISRATLTSTGDLVATVPSNARYYRYSMLVNSGMTDETVIYDENMQINIADTSIEADYLQKMGVLRTTGKNLVFLGKNNPDALGSNYGAGTSAIQYDDEKQAFYTSTHRGMCSNITFKPNTYYIISAEFLLRKTGSYSFLWQNPQQSTGTTFNDTPFNETTWIRRSIKRLSDNNGKIGWIVYEGVWFRNLQIEEAESLTEYEPYKSNILLVNEEVKLCGVGDVKDELNILTGEYTQRIGIREYQEGDETNTEVLTDLTNTYYVLESEVVGSLTTTILDQDDNTIENLHTFNTKTHINTYAQGGGLIPFVYIPENISYDTGSMLKPNTTYTLQINRKESDYPFVAIVGDKEIEVQGNKAVLTTLSTINDTDIKFYGKNNIISKVQLIEGDHSSVDIPYFEGVQSIKMPVLKATGKNLMSVNHARLDGITMNAGAHAKNLVAKNIPVTPGKTYTISYSASRSTNIQANSITRYEHQEKTISENHTQLWNEIGKDDVKLTFTIPQGINYISLTFGNAVYTNNGIPGWIQFDNIQLEEASVATEYEPFKSNILTTNEEVELRGIGDVKDELNVLTGEIIERTSQGILNGTETWTRVSNSDGFYTRVNTLKKSETYNNLIIADKIRVEVGHNYDSFMNSPTNAMTGFTGITAYPNENWIYLKIIGIENVESLKAYLQQNPINYSYVLGEENVKTVDLSIVDQNGKEIDNIHTFDNITHINTDSNGLIPIVNINKEVSYESILKPSTTYTFSFNQVNIGDEDLIINIGGTEVVYDGSENMTITTPSELLNNTISFYGKNHIINNLVMVEGEEKINIYGYFTGMTNYKKESDKKSILIINNCPFVFGKGGRK